MAYPTSSIPRSYAPAPSIGNSAAHSRLLAQQSEVEGFLRLAAQSKQFGDSLEGLGQQTEQLVIGGRGAFALSTWKGRFDLLQLSPTWSRVGKTSFEPRISLWVRLTSLALCESLEK